MQHIKRNTKSKQQEVYSTENRALLAKFNNRVIASHLWYKASLAFKKLDMSAIHKVRQRYEFEFLKFAARESRHVR